MKLSPRSILLLGLALNVCKSHAFLPPAQAPLPDVDRRPGPPNGQAITAEQQAAADILRARLPMARVDFDPITGAPTMVSAVDGFLTSPGGQGKAVSASTRLAFMANDPHAAVKAFLEEHRRLFGYGPEALSQARTNRDFVSANNGLHTVVWQQHVDDVPVFEAMLLAHTTKAGELVNVSSQLLPDPSQATQRSASDRAALVAAPPISVSEAIARAVQSLGDDTAVAGQLTTVTEPTDAARSQKLNAPFLRGQAEAKLTWLPMNNQGLRLCWDIILTGRQQPEMFRLLVDAQTGEVLLRRCLTAYLATATFNVFTNDSPTPFSPGFSTPTTTQPPQASRALVTLSALNTNTSPNGWLDDSANETLGNNVDAHTDRNNDDSPDLPRPQGTPFRTFDFPLDLSSQDPTNFSKAAVVQLFYLCNWMHDKLYELGFTEAAGNFQSNNFGRGGLGSDALQADAQDGGGTDNANMSTPPDGSAPRMQMYLWSGPSPRRDGDYDAEVVLHEYTHGLSNRRVGGGVGLSALQSEGMGEGWSDFYGMSLLSEAGDDVNGCYASGGYASYLLDGLTQNYYFGIRRYPYCTDMSKNPLTFKDIDTAQASTHTGIPRSPVVGTTANEVHNMGEVWCVTLWDVRANLINKLGYAVGNHLALQLVTDGMNLSPANPNFLQARDAILQAELVDCGGTNRNVLWAAFAKRGMGASASSPTSSTTTGLVEAYDVPDALAITPAIAGAAGPVGGPFSPNPASFSLTNSGSVAFTWSLANTCAWLTVTPPAGILTPGGPAASVSASVGSAANTLPMEVYNLPIWFTNQSSGVAQSRTFALSVVGRSLFDSFDPGINLSLWASFGGVVGSTVVATNYGGFISGPNALWFGDDGTRSATTMPLDTSAGGTLSFYIRLANGSVWPWEEADDLPYEGCVLESTANSGSTWTVLGSYDTTAYYNWTAVSLPIPTVAQAPAVQFRWRQKSHSGASYDHWALDNVSIDSGPTPPGILTQPGNVAAMVGGAASFGVVASGSSPLAYQWNSNGAPVTGATSSTFILANVQSNMAAAYNVVITNLYGSVTSSAAMLQVVPALAGVAVFADSRFIDMTAGGNGAEGLNVQATVTNLGFAVFAFTNVPDAAAAFTTLIFPEQEITLVAPALGSGRQALSNAVAGGALLLVYGGEGGAASLLNNVFGFGLVESSQSSSGPTYSLTTQAAGTIFAGGPATIPCNNGTSTLTGLPSGAVSIYDYSGLSAVTLIPFGNGTIIFLGFDWYNAYPIGTQDGGWVSVLQRALMARAPTGPSIWSQPQSATAYVGETATVTVTARGSQPITYQWQWYGTNLPGATASSLSLCDVQLAQAGPYTVALTNAYGYATSSIAVLTVLPAPPCCAPPPGLLSWWKAEGSPLDQLGLTQGTLLGNAGYGAGRVGQGFTFDGSGDAVFLGSAPALQLQDFTIETWLRRSSSSVVSLDSCGNGMLLAFGSGGFGLYLDAYGYVRLTRMDVDNTTAGPAITDTYYHHVAVTKTGTTVVFYIDGTAYAAPYYSTTYTFTTPAAIGIRPDNSTCCFYGTIDEPSVYNRALLAAEIQTIYAARSTGKCVAPAPPVFFTQPAGLSVAAGDTAVFNPLVSGTPPLSCQWRLNGVPLPEGTNLTLTVTNVQFSDSGSYSLVVSNIYGSAVSSNALLTVTWPVQTLNAADLGWYDDTGTHDPANANYIVGRLGGKGYRNWFVFNIPAMPGMLMSATLKLNVYSVSTPSGTEVLQLSEVTTPVATLTNGGSGLTYIYNDLADGVSYATFPVVSSNSYQSISIPLNSAGLAALTAARGQAFAFGGNITNLSGSDEFVFGSSYGEATDAQLILVSGPGVPTITTQPLSQTVPVGANPCLAVFATGQAPLAYQWRKDGAPVSYATNSALCYYPVALTDMGGYDVIITNSLGAITSSVATLAVYVPTPPAITQQPQGLTVAGGSNAGFSVVATGDLPLAYQWCFNSAPLPGATGTGLRLGDVQAVNGGPYTVVITNFLGSITSDVATLAVTPSRPFFTVQPISRAFFPGFGAAFSAAAMGTEPFFYQWQFQGVDIPGATNPTLTLTNLPAGSAGLYQAVVSNSVGAITSVAARLTLVPVAAWGYDATGQSDLWLALTNAVQVAAGGSHSVALCRDGSVFVWGNTNVVTSPVGLTGVVSVAAGGSHGLALGSDGTVRAFGDNSYGQSSVPAGLTNVVAVSAGGNHSLAVRVDGTVAAWGDNSYGQLYIPSGLSNVVAIAAGGNHSLALRGDGKVFAWGSMVYKEATVPTNLADVVAIAAGGSHSLSLRSDGTVVAWGANSYGQTNLPAGLSNIVAIAGGAFHTLALKHDGSLFAWGAGTNQGLSSYPDAGQSIVPSSVTNVTGISGGAAHSVAFAGGAAPFITEPPLSRRAYSGRRVGFRAAGTGAFPLRYQWQLNNVDIPGATGQLLTIANAGSSWAGAYRVVISNAFGTAISTAADLALVDSAPLVLSQPVGRSAYLGSQASFQVSVDGSGPFYFQWRLNGANISGATDSTLLLSRVVTNQAGVYSVVVSNAFGAISSSKATLSVLQVLAWGAGTNYLVSPSYGQSIVPVGLSGVTAVAGGGYHTLALKNDGRVLAWGAGTNYSTMPNYGQALVPGSATNIIAVAAGLYHSLALKADGTVLAWGAGTSNYVSPSYGQAMVPAGLGNVVAIAAGDYHSVALKGDGRVAVWGYNYYYQTNVPAAATNVVAIASRGNHILALKGDGSFLHWGYYSTLPGSVSNTVTIAAGVNHCLALKADGTVVSWGGSYGVPSGLSNVVDIAAGSDFSLALRIDGSVVTWGNTNLYGLGWLPSGLNSVVGIACGTYHSLAVLGDGSLLIRRQPANTATYLGGTASFRVLALGSQPVACQWQCNGNNISGATNTALTMTNVQIGDAANYCLVLSNCCSCVTSAPASLTVLLPLGFALDNTNLLWSASGNAAWFGQYSITHDGTDAAQSGLLTDSQSSTLQTTVVGGGTLSFWWKVSSEEWFDYLSFYIDSVRQAGVSGEVDWQFQTYAVPDGIHTLRWVYAKDASVGVGSDAGWLDQVVFITNPPVIIAQPLSQIAAPGAPVLLWASASGAPTLTYQWLKNGANLPGATAPSFYIAAATRRDAARYTLAVSNPGGTTLSSNALLQVPTPQQLSTPNRWPDGAFTLLSGDFNGGLLEASDLPNFEAQASTNLADWVTLPNALSLTNGLLLLRDPGTANSPARFYRILEHY